MVKFFKKAPEKCSICGNEKEIFKRLKSKGIELKYCNDCYNEYYKRIEQRAKEQIMNALKSGKTLGIKDALELTKQITKEIEEEQINKKSI